ncbi:hypothetical protein GWI33_019719 [Rhynchophorus ferrugineus]|uniref:Lipase domain-containing protein n=1 Tax=Rhynchophorus ferrugineus TaxID=354439 RepID=A0A834M150_RHYFE|nr:hypothetical protein GWI33_019719 [Rhynchophorus ferrugineus]
MKLFIILAAIAACLNANPVKYRVEDLSEVINNPRYLVYETEDGFFEIEDLYNATAEAEAEVFATEDDVSFYFFNRNNLNGVEIKESQLNNIIALTGFSVNKQTLVVIHGWKNSVESPVNDQIKTAALRNNDINVIVVDWSKIASKIYVTAQGSVLKVGNYVGDFLLKLDNVLNHSLSRVTIVGHSLGAHISGNAGARTGGLIDTIIGLDPAGPLFTEKNINNRLDPTDGRYVHVIHTNDRVLGFGIKMGHLDYYPNGGSSQPGCGLDVAGSCAHSRAYIYYAESLSSNRFLSRLCSSYSDYTNGRCASNTASYMGSFPITQSAQGDYYLTTNSASPYAQG